MNPVVVDLSHHDVLRSFAKVKASGIKAVIYKATQGTAYVDPSYAGRRKAAAEVGLLWGAYHFMNDQDVTAQVDHFLAAAKPDADTLLALDWEPNGNQTASLAQAKEFLRQVHERTGQKPVLYSGNLVKECLKGKADPFLSGHRLWLAQYGPEAKCPPGWDSYWLWQYTGDAVGEGPHEVDGITTKGIDLNVFGGADLEAEWAPVHPPEDTKPFAEPQPAHPVIDTVKVATQSRTVWAQIAAAASVVFGALTDTIQRGWDALAGLLGVVPAIADDVRPTLNSAQEVAGWFHVSWTNISLTVAAVAIVIAIVRHIDLKRKAVS